jgi:hypothetical protein
MIGYRMQDGRYKIQDAGWKIQDGRYKMQDTGLLKFRIAGCQLNIFCFTRQFTDYNF